MLHPSVAHLVFSSCVMATLWVWATTRRRLEIVDVGWAVCTASGALLWGIIGEGDPPRRWCIALLTALWAARLLSHLIPRLSTAPDPRYERLLGSRFGTKRLLFIFFQFQAVLGLILSVAFVPGASSIRGFPDVFDILGIGISLTGLATEAVADYQLRRFKEHARPGSLCTVGLWRYSRNANYFGEWLFWCGFPFFAGSFEGFLAAAAAPALMYLLLVKVTGVPPKERRLQESRPQPFAEYVRTTNQFFPWIPKG